MVVLPYLTKNKLTYLMELIIIQASLVSSGKAK